MTETEKGTEREIGEKDGGQDLEVVIGEDPEAAIEKVDLMRM